MKCRNPPIVLQIFVAHGLKVRQRVVVATSFSMTGEDVNGRGYMNSGRH